MAERKIDPKFNIHPNYNRVNIVNPYRFGSTPPPTGGGTEPEYQAVLDYANANFIQLPDSAQQEADNNIIAGLKSVGVWSELDCFMSFKGTASSAFKLIDWKRTIKATAFGGLTWSATGVQGNASNGYINTLFNQGTQRVKYTIDEASHGVGVFNGTATGILIGSRDSTGSLYHTLIGKTANNSSDFLFRMNARGDQSNLSKLNLTGNNLFTVSGSRRYYDLNGINEHLGVPGSGGLGIENQNVYLLAANTNGTASLYSGMGLTYWLAGGALTNKASQINTIL